MERLIVIYEENSYDYSCTKVFPVKYESKEKFLKDFENKVLEYHLALYDFNKAQKKWFRSRPNFKSAKFDEWHKNEPKLNLKQIFDINGVEFDAIEFMYKDEYQPPTVLTVDEWFDSFKS